MGIFQFFSDLKTKREEKQAEIERSLLAEPYTVKAKVVEILRSHSQEWVRVGDDENETLVDDYWTKPVVEYEVNGQPIRSEVGEPRVWKHHGYTCPYKEGEYVIVRYKAENLSRCDILRKCYKRKA
ncbi:MAG: hypothetical protein Q4B70_08430 [Lachnospiraceae bacterium]|nr:hypothetical protein [Lachnospiraceae bacterium]